MNVKSNFYLFIRFLEVDTEYTKKRMEVVCARKTEKEIGLDIRKEKERREKREGRRNELESEKEKGVEGTMYHHEVRRGAVVGTRLTLSKNDRRCLPCFLQASQFQPLLVVSSCCYPPLLLLLLLCCLWVARNFWRS